MNLLRVQASNFKNCEDNFTIDFVAKAKKTSEDKEYELLEVADGLYVCNVAVFVGKNASGKTTAIELLDCCYSILGDFRLEHKSHSYENMKLTMDFFHEGWIYRYHTVLHNNPTLSSRAVFEEQSLKRKKYYKSHRKEIYDDVGLELLDTSSPLPEDTSVLFFALRKRATRAVYFDCHGKGADTYQLLFQALRQYNIDDEAFFAILQLFDENIHSLAMTDNHSYQLTDQSGTHTLSAQALAHRMSGGTTKGLLLYTFMVASLQNGFTLLIDEIENHLHRSLVENMVALYKDTKVNRFHATLIFTTHCGELLDMFGRQDNIWIANAHEKVQVKRMFDELQEHSDPCKSKLQTAVNYDHLMALKKELMK